MYNYSSIARDSSPLSRQTGKPPSYQSALVFCTFVDVELDLVARSEVLELQEVSEMKLRRIGKNQKGLREGDGNGADKAQTYRQLPRPMQALNLVDAIAHAVNRLLELGIVDHALSSVQNEHGVRADVVVDVDRDDVSAVEFCERMR